MSRDEILKEVEESFGFVPGWLGGMPDAVLDQYWAGLQWVMSDTKLASRDKVLVAYGAATAIHCGY